MKNSNLIFITCVILSLIALYSFVTPEFEKYSNLKKEVSILEENLAKIQDHKESTKQAYKKISSGSFEYIKLNGAKDTVYYTEDIDGERKNPIIDSAIPNQVRKAALFNLYYSLTKSSGVELDKILISKKASRSKSTSEINTQKALDDLGVKYDTLAITVVGSYDNFKRFIQNLEKSARFIKIDSIDFRAPNFNVARKNGERPENYFSFDLSTRVYSLKKSNN